MSQTAFTFLVIIVTAGLILLGDAWPWGGRR